LASQATITKKITRSNYADYRLFSSLRRDHRLDLALPNLKDGVSRVPLRKYNIAHLINGLGSAAIHRGKKLLGVKWPFLRGFCHGASCW
jgi:hypothetical protein